MEPQGRDFMPRGDSNLNWVDSRTGLRPRTKAAVNQGQLEGWDQGTHRS